MIDPKSIVLSWRAEIAAELAEAEKALPPLQAAHEAAKAAADEATAAHVALNQFLGKVTSETDIIGNPRFKVLEGALGWRAAEVGWLADRAKQQRARALGDLEVARAKLASLRRALAQIDLVAPPADEVGEAA